MAKAPVPFSTQLYLLEDHARTLFPLTTTRVVVTKALSEIQQHIAQIFDQKTSDAFLVQQRCYASKTGYHLRRTAALDPVAAYFIYDLIYTHRAKLGSKPSAVRRSFGYRFAGGRPIAPSISYGSFRKAIREAFPKFKHALAFDISSYFNSIYHHDLTEWFEASVAAGPHIQLGQFLRECNKGRSVDCLPHGFHPCKAIGAAFLTDVDSSVQLESALLLRFLDDFYLFDNDEHLLNSDFLKIQHLLGERGLTLNTNKTKRDDEVMRLAPGTIDEIKVELLERRREIVVDEYGRETVEDVDEEEDDDPLTEEQLEYLLELLKNPDIDESDAELVLRVLKSRDEDVLEHLTDILDRFPSLTRRIYSYSKHIDDVTELPIPVANNHLPTQVTLRPSFCDSAFDFPSLAPVCRRMPRKCPLAPAADSAPMKSPPQLAKGDGESLAGVSHGAQAGRCPQGAARCVRVRPGATGSIPA
jgi:hypothetical protein